MMTMAPSRALIWQPALAGLPDYRQGLACLQQYQAGRISWIRYDEPPSERTAGDHGENDVLGESGAADPLEGIRFRIKVVHAGGRRLDATAGHQAPYFQAHLRGHFAPV